MGFDVDVEVDGRGPIGDDGLRFPIVIFLAVFFSSTKKISVVLLLPIMIILIVFVVVPTKVAVVLPLLLVMIIAM